FALIATVPELVTALTAGGLNATLGYHAAREARIGLLLTRLLLFGCLCSGAVALLGALALTLLGDPTGLSEQLGGWIWIAVLMAPLLALKTGLLSLHSACGQVREFNNLRLLESVLPL